MVPPPKEGPNKKLIGGIVAAVVILGGVGIGSPLAVERKEATRLAEQTRTLLKWLINHRKKLKWKLKQAVRIPKNR